MRAQKSRLQSQFPRLGPHGYTRSFFLGVGCLPCGHLRAGERGLGPTHLAGSSLGILGDSRLCALSLDKRAPTQVCRALGRSAEILNLDLRGAQ